MGGIDEGRSEEGPWPTYGSGIWLLQYIAAKVVSPRLRRAFGAGSEVRLSCGLGLTSSYLRLTCLPAFTDPHLSEALYRYSPSLPHNYCLPRSRTLASPPPPRAALEARGLQDIRHPHCCGPVAYTRTNVSIDSLTTSMAVKSWKGGKTDSSARTACRLPAGT